MRRSESVISLPDLPAGQAGFSLSPRIDQVGVEERASRFTKRSIKKESKMNGLKLVLNMIDLTTLEGKDAHRAFYEALFAKYEIRDVTPLDRVAEEWYMFAELRLTAPIPESGVAEGTRTTNPACIPTVRDAASAPASA